MYQKENGSQLVLVDILVAQGGSGCAVAHERGLNFRVSDDPPQWAVTKSGSPEAELSVTLFCHECLGFAAGLN